MENQTTLLNKKNLVFFAENFGKELNRYNENGNFVNSIECTEENMFNLFDSQDEEKTKYGETFFYSLYSE
jgi:hypothetical protein